MKKLDFKQKRGKLFSGINARTRILTTAGLVSAVAIGFGTGVYFINSKTPNASPVQKPTDPVQSRLAFHQQQGIGAVEKTDNTATEITASPDAVRSAFGLKETSRPNVSNRTIAPREAVVAVNHDLTNALGKDLAEIDLRTIETADKSVSYTQELPASGIVAVATNVSLVKGGQTIVANAYDYVNLKYVRYDKQSKEIEDVKYAPPPGLFGANVTV